MSKQLDRIHAVAAERRANKGLYDHQRTSENTFVDLLCFLLGYEAISDEHLDAAIAYLAEADARIVAHREAVSS